MSLPTPSNSKNHSVNKEVFRPIHYLGSKLRILKFIEEVIDTIDPDKGRVCDLFAGSGSVSFMLSKTRPVTSVDIQEYSSIISKTLLNPVKLSDSFINSFVDNCLKSQHTADLFFAVQPLIDFENSAITTAINKTALEKLCAILEGGSIISFELTGSDKIPFELEIIIKQTLGRLREKSVSNKQSLSIRYFGGVYFSYEQAVQIDAILEQIEKEDSIYKNILLSSLLSAASECVNTVGKQFAQPIMPRKPSGQIKPGLGKMVEKDRSLSIFKVFEKWIKKYNAVDSIDYDNQVLKQDYSIALNNLPSDTTIVYADPPYTREHYSRFYHVLETIALRDTPEISTIVSKGKTILSRGLYRAERHQSVFCIRSSAPKAFELMFSKVSALGAKLILSYSPYDESKGSHPRVITMPQLIALAEKYYTNVEVLSPGTFVHSKLNSSAKHLEASEFAEVLIVCT